MVKKRTYKIILFILLCYLLINFNFYVYVAAKAEEDNSQEIIKKLPKPSFKQAIITYEYKGSLKGKAIAYIDVEKNKICIETHTYRNLSGGIDTNNHIEIDDGNTYFFCNLDENVAVKTEREGDIFLMFGKQSPNQKTQREIFLGKDCNVYQSEHRKRYFWQGILLKDEAIGYPSPLYPIATNYTQEATDIQLDVAIPPSKFELPKGIKIMTHEELGKAIESKYGENSTK